MSGLAMESLLGRRPQPLDFATRGDPARRHAAIQAICNAQGALVHCGNIREEPVMPLRPLLPGCLILLLALGCASAPHPATAPSGTNVAAAQAALHVDPPSSPDWEADMAGFDAQDAASKPPRDAFVFTGSSSVRMWDTLATDFPGKPLLNRGFGGSQLRDSVHYAQQIAVRYQPRMILIYAGDNDIDAGRSPQQVLHDFRAFVARIRRDLPDTPIAFLAIKPSPLRAQQLPRQQQANALVRAEARRLHQVEFIDVATPMLGADGQPRAELFIEDRLHMNRAGYELWRGIVAPYLD